MRSEKLLLRTNPAVSKTAARRDSRGRPPRAFTRPRPVRRRSASRCSPHAAPAPRAPRSAPGGKRTGLGRSRLLALRAAAALAALALTVGCAGAARSPYGRGMETRPADVVEQKQAQPEESAAADLVEKLEEQRRAIERASADDGSAESRTAAAAEHASPAGGTTAPGGQEAAAGEPGREQSPAEPPVREGEGAARAGEEPAAAGAPETSPPETAESLEPERERRPAEELTVEYLISLLESRGERSPAEEEAYRRLLGIAESGARPAQGSRAYNLLGQARDAVMEGDMEAAQSLASRALAELRRRTDPSIDRLIFATEVRNYGNADVVEDPSFRPGQQVLVVADLSNFACEPVGSDSAEGGPLYHTRMTQRLAIYAADGSLAWQKSHGPFEYQAEGYVATMFVPRVFRLPQNLKSGEYTLKCEVEDLLAERRDERSVEFEIR